MANDIKSPRLARRNVLRGSAAFLTTAVVSGAIGGAAGGFGEGFYKSLFNGDTDDIIERRLFKNIFDINDLPPSIFPGSGNMIGRALGKSGISAYLSFSSAVLTSYIARSLGVAIESPEDNFDDALVYQPNRQSIFLGSPVANHVSAYIMGYDMETSVPQVDYKNAKTRWAISFGERDFGVYNDRLETVARISRSTSEVVERPVYKLVDKIEKTISSPSTKDGMLINEWLIITRIRDAGKIRTLFAGAHGYSTEAFFRDFANHLHSLDRLVDDADQFQALIPVELIHVTSLNGNPRTIGNLVWERAEIHRIR